MIWVQSFCARLKSESLLLVIRTRVCVVSGATEAANGHLLVRLPPLGLHFLSHFVLTKDPGFFSSLVSRARCYLPVLMDYAKE